MTDQIQVQTSTNWEFSSDSDNSPAEPGEYISNITSAKEETEQIQVPVTSSNTINSITTSTEQTATTVNTKTSTNLPDATNYVSLPLSLQFQVEH